MPIEGVTILALDDQDRFTNVAIHHRPLTAVLAFSAELAEHLAASPGADHFHQGP
jgi:hypothetical protein